MGKKYTVYDIINMVKKASSNMDTFYNEKFVNYQGKTSDTNIFYIEIIAKYLSQNITLFNSIKTIHRQNTYCTGTHLSEYDSTSNHTEEIIVQKHFYVAY